MTKPRAAASATMEQFVREQTAARLDRFAFELQRAAKARDADAVHDLRVSIRRLSQCLRVFRQFFPAREVKRIRRRLRAIMDHAADVRNRDIARQLLKKTGVGTTSSLYLRLGRERKQAERALVNEILRMSRGEFSSRWRRRLGL